MTHATPLALLIFAVVVLGVTCLALWYALAKLDARVTIYRNNAMIENHELQIRVATLQNRLDAAYGLVPSEQPDVLRPEDMPADDLNELLDKILLERDTAKQSAPTAYDKLMSDDEVLS